MKNSINILCMVLATMGSFHVLHAQTDIKISPFGLLFNRGIARIEFPAATNVGVEVLGGAAWNSFDFEDQGDIRFQNYHLGVNGRYYFSPSKGLDKFYLGAYSKFNGGTARDKSTDATLQTTRLSLGTLIGFKTLAKNEHLLFDFNVGLGRALIYKIEGDAGSNDINLSDFPILNWDLPVLVGIGWRF